MKNTSLVLRQIDLQDHVQFCKRGFNDKLKKRKIKQQPENENYFHLAWPCCDEKVVVSLKEKTTTNPHP